MKLIVQGKQMRITEGMRRFAEEHVVRPLRRFYDDEAAELRVEVGRENGNRGESTECHLTFRMPGTRTIQIEESTPDPYACLALATAVAEGGVPGGLVEDLPQGRALRRVEQQLSPRRPRKK